jgi:hypothetical protein
VPSVKDARVGPAHDGLLQSVIAGLDPAISRRVLALLGAAFAVPGGRLMSTLTGRTITLLTIAVLAVTVLAISVLTLPALAIARLRLAALAVAVLAGRLTALAAVAAVAGSRTLRPAAVAAIAAVAGAGTLCRPAVAALSAAAGLARTLAGTALMLSAVAAAMAHRKAFACRRALGVIFNHADEGMILDHRKLHADDPLDVTE